MKNRSSYTIYTFLIFSVLFLSLTLKRKTENQQGSSDSVEYLKEHWAAPVDYVVSKFEQHEYVFIGEYHRLDHDVQLILDLMPALYKSGVYNLGIEFADYDDQHLVDSLLALPVFNRDLARKIMFNCSPDWAYEKYIDIYEVAWNINHSEQALNKQKFRVVNLAAHYDPCKKGGAWKDVNPDEFMANSVKKEFIEKGEKALIYAGNHHSFTKYHQPIYDFQKDTLLGYNDSRMGNIIYDLLGDKVFNIYLHAAWTSSQGWSEQMVLPVDGKIDDLMSHFDHKPVGFDVINTPLGKLTSSTNYYSLGYPDFTLDQYCDGYIYQKRISDYSMVSIEKGYINEGNIDAFKDYLLCVGVHRHAIDTMNVEIINSLLQENIKDHFGDLIE